MWRYAFIGVGVLLACGDDKPTRDTSVEVQSDVGEVAPDSTVAPDGTDEVTPLAGCLARPDVVLAPPGAGLPCELLPPGLVLTR